MERPGPQDHPRAWQQRFVEAIRRAMGLSNVAWLDRHGPDHVVLVAASGDGIDGRRVAQARPVEPGALASVMANGKPLLLNPSSHLSLGVPYADRPVKICGAAAFSVANGWVWADRADRAILPEEMDGLMQTASLAEEQGRNQSTLGPVLEKLELLSRTVEGARLLFSTASDQDCLAELLDAGVRLSGAEMALVALLDADSGQCKVVATVGDRARPWMGHLFDPSSGLVGLVLRTGQAMPTGFRVSSVTSDLLGKEHDIDLKPGDPILVHPLGLQTDMHGALILVRGDFDREWLLHGVRTLCNSAALYLHQARLRDRLAREAMHDGLTGLPNKRAFMDTLGRLMALCKRHDAPLSLLMVDVDHFKRVNDTHGHLVGDRVLRFIAETIGHALRESDTGGRYGGEEFCVVLPHTDAAGAVGVAERIRKLCENAVVQVGGIRLALTVSIGVAVLLSGMHTQEDLIKPADEALYEAKRTGRNKVVLKR